MLIIKNFFNMTVLHQNGVVMKAWYFFRTYILTLRRFDLVVQGSLLIVILLDTNLYLLLRRDHAGGKTPALIEDWILVSAAGVEFILGSVVGWWGRHKRNFALSAWLGVAALSASLVLFVPFQKAQSSYVELCGGDPAFLRAAAPESGKTARLALLIISAVVCALTKLSIWAHGFTYLDDHEPQNGPYFYGILICIRLSLGLSGPNWLQPSSLRDDWWKAHLILCCLTLMFSIFLTLFPTQMNEFPGDEEETTVSEDYLPSLLRVVRNTAVVMQTLAIALLSAAVFGFIRYDKAYVQAKFHVEAYRQDPRSSRALTDIFRTLVIVFFIMIFRVRFSARRSDGVKANTAARVGGVVAAIVSVLFALMAALGCDVADIEGTDEQYTQPACSMHCGCDSARYGFSPVCGLETRSTYFSPCHAGCQEARDLNGFPLYLNCTCGVQSAVRGACSINQCRLAFSAYQVIYTIFLAVAGSSLMMQGMAIVRAVRRSDKPIAQGVSMAGVALLASVIGHLIYMLISYMTCVFESEGRCVLHHQTLWITCCVSSLLSLSSAAVSLLASRTHAHIPTTEL